MKKLLLFAGIVYLITTNNPVQAQAPLDITPKVLSVTETISYYALLNQTDESQMLAVSKCESGYRQTAIGLAGEIGIFQYKKSTFDGFAKQMGETLDIHSYTDQSKVTAWVWKNHPEYRNQWTCFTKMVK